MHGVHEDRIGGTEARDTQAAGRADQPPRVPGHGEPGSLEDQEQLRLWLEALGGRIEQLGVEAGALRNRLACLQGAYFSASSTRQPPADAADSPCSQEAFALVVDRLLNKVRDQR